MHRGYSPDDEEEKASSNSNGSDLNWMALLAAEEQQRQAHALELRQQQHQLVHVQSVLRATQQNQQLASFGYDNALMGSTTAAAMPRGYQAREMNTLATARSAGFEGYAATLSQANSSDVASLQDHSQLFGLQQGQGWMQQRRLQGILNNAAVARPFPLVSQSFSTHSQSSLTPLLQAALDQIPVSEKTDLLRALHVAPQLVTMESDPFRFLRHQNLHVTSAARKLVEYWKRRREIFGDRAFLPMTASGDGALTAEVIEFLTSGVQTILPKDSEGCTVMCFDSSRRLECCPATRLQAAFWIGHEISLNDRSQTEGFVVLNVISDPKIDGISSECHAMIMQCFPLKVKAWHFLDCIPGWNRHISFKNCVNAKLQVFSPYILKHPTFTHTSQSKYAETLENCGISRDGLPSCLGGRWSYEDINLTHVHEREISSPAAMQTNTPRPSYVRTVTGSASLHDTSLGSGDSNNDSKPSGIETPTVEDQDQDSKPAAVNSSARGEKSDVFRRLLQKALQLLPQAVKVAYVEALDRAPQVIWEEESNPEFFLRAEHFHPWFAAKRLVRYWHTRSHTFGDKQHLSLYQNGEDALDRGDLAVLGSGFAKALPKDERGCPVLCVDPNCLPENTPKDCEHRCLFYMHSLLAESRTAQSEGAVLLYRTNTDSTRRFDFSFINALADAMPLRFKSVHVFISSNNADKAVIESQVKFGDQTYFYPPQPKEQLAAIMEGFDMRKSGLPEFVGGSWGATKFLHWTEFRTRMEWRIPMGLGGRDMDEALTFPCIRRYSILPDEEKTERKRRLNVIHSRRKRDRKRVRETVVQDQCTELTLERGALIAENRRLRDLVASAQVIVKQLERAEEGHS